ncbi:MAG: HD domain-containing protein [Chloroflexota bacterium]|nr:HD domain-containing protein [Chloroflexota bacterium]
MLNRAFEEPADGRDETRAVRGDAPSNVVPLPVQPGAAAEAEARLPRPALVYVLLVFALGLAAVAYFAPQLNTSDLTGFVILGVLAVAAGRTRISIYGDTTISLGMVGDFAVALLFGPAGAVIVGPVAALLADHETGAPWYKRLFDIGSVTLSNLTIAGVAWLLMGGHMTTSALLVAVTAATVVVYYAVNTTLVATAASLATRRQTYAVWHDDFAWLLPHYVVAALLGAALAVGYAGVGVLGILAFAAPPLLVRLSMKQYIDKTAENVEELRKTNQDLQKANTDILQMADELRRTYDGTLEALVSALDARDRETKGHSIRVAKYMMEIAYHMGIAPGTDEWLDMQRGALLHDVGKIGVSDTILHKPGPLTDEEWVDMRRHPKIGHDMLKDISFLSGAASLVLAHHERFDGKGYPLGLLADEIPLGARIFVLADTFDAMTSDRPYRRALSAEVSRDEIIKCSGSQFDPRCVQAFLLAFDEIVKIRMADHEAPTEHHAAAAPKQAA